MDSAVAPRKIRIMFLGVVIGLTIGIFIIYYNENKKDLVYKKEEIQSFLNYKNLIDLCNYSKKRMACINKTSCNG